MQPEIFQLTHFYRAEPNPDGWIQTDFITTDLNHPEERYFLGFDGNEISNLKIEDDLKNGSLICLTVPFTIAEDETVWITNRQEIVIANADNPSEGRRQIVYRDKVSDVYDTVSACIKNMLMDNANEINRHNLENCVAPNSWKILLGQILKGIYQGEIRQKKNFNDFGYLFFYTQKLYSAEFLGFANAEKFAIAYGSLCFEIKKKFVRWEIILPEDLDPRSLFQDDYSVKDEEVDQLFAKVKQQKSEYFDQI